MPTDVADTLHRQLRPYRDRHPDVRWTPRPSWHLTLLFLGAVPPKNVDRSIAVMEEAAATWAPYKVGIRSADGHLRGRDGVAWLALDQGASDLISNAERLAARCPPDLTLGAPPKRSPSAHLTVVRRADASVIEALRGQQHGRLAASWTVDRVRLVRSELRPDGARHETLHEAAL